MEKLISLLLFVCLACSALAQVTARKTVVRQVDADANGKTNPGDTLRYTIVITNTSSSNLLNVQFNDANFPNQTLVGGSIKSTPIARPDSYTGVIGNTVFNVAAPGVLANDSDPDGDTVLLVGFSAASAHGGTVTVTNNGGFTFLSAAGYQGTDSFTYTVSDGNGGTNIGTVTLTISNMVWYVNNAGANGDGRQTSPFNSLAPVNGVSGVNDFIYLFQGSGNYTAGIVLKNSQQLVGSGDALVVGATTIFGAGARPTILATSGTGVGLGTDNIVHGLNIRSASGRAISGATAGNLVISNVLAAATGGAVVNLAGGTVNVMLDSATSTNSVDNGVMLSTINGSFVVNAGFITGAAGTDFSVSGGNGTVTFPGGINNTAGRSVDINGHTGGTITLSGNITDTGTGIIVQNCTGGTTTFSGATKTLNTGANAAVNLVNNSGTTINFSNGGLAITRTSGIGFNATGGATAISVTGAGNTIGSGTSTALNVVSTTIGASGLTFQSISANNTLNGIVLNNTGTSGGLTITGTGAANSGGTIQSTTGDGIVVTDTQDLKLTRVLIQNIAGDGINGTNLRGTNLLANSTIQDFDVNRTATKDGFRIVNLNANLGLLTITATTFNGTTSDAVIPGSNDGVFMEAQGTSSMALSVEGGCVFTEMFGDGVQVNSITGASGLVNVTVKSCFFTNAAVLGNGGISLNPFGGPANFTADVDSNRFDDILRPTTNLGAIGTTSGDLDGSGPTANLTFRNNTITNIVGARGITATFDTFAGPTTLIISNNVIDYLGSSTKSAISVNVLNNVTANVKIQNNKVGQFATLYPTTASAFADVVLLTSQNSAVMNALLSGNACTANTGFEVMRTRAIQSATINATVMGNTLSDTAGSHVEFEAVTGTITVVGGTICLNMSGNTVPVGGVGVIRVAENARPGVINVTQSQANLASLNNGATVTVTGTPQFSQPSCLTP